MIWNIYGKYFKTDIFKRVGHNKEKPNQLVFVFEMEKQNHLRAAMLLLKEENTEREN